MRNGLETELGQQILAVNLRDDGTLVVVATGPEWAARLRFENERLLSLARELRPAAGRVRIRVGQME